MNYDRFSLKSRRTRMLTVECDCGHAVPFNPVPGGETTPLKEACPECGAVYKLSISKVHQPREVESDDA
jgi:rRNA maturation protein Nop10